MSETAAGPATDEEKAALMLRLMKAAIAGDDPAGIQAMLRELEAADPGALQRIRAAAALRRARWPTRTVQ